MHEKEIAGKYQKMFSVFLFSRGISRENLFTLSTRLNGLFCCHTEPPKPLSHLSASHGIFQELGEVWNGFMQAVGASRKVFELIDRKPLVHNYGRIKPDSTISKLEGKIEFKNVKFSYPIRPDLPVMRVCTFSLDRQICDEFYFHKAFQEWLYVPL